MKFKFIKTFLFFFVLVIIAYAVFSAYTDIKRNMSLSEHYESTPKLQIILVKASWCGHCQKYEQSGVFNNTYELLKPKQEYSDIKFVTYDFDENKALGEKYGINGFPTIIAIDADGKLLATFEGDRYNKTELIKFVDDDLKKL